MEEPSDINRSLRDLFVGGLLFQNFDEQPTRRGEIGWIHFDAGRGLLLIMICYLAEEDLDDTWWRLVDIPIMYTLKVQKSFLANRLSGLASGKIFSLIIPDGELENEKNIQIFTSKNPWLGTGLADFNSTTH